MFQQSIGIADGFGLVGMFGRFPRGKTAFLFTETLTFFFLEREKINK